MIAQKLKKELLPCKVKRAKAKSPQNKRGKNTGRARMAEHTNSFGYKMKVMGYIRLCLKTEVHL